MRTAVITEGTALPPENTAIVRVFNAATDAGSIDVYVTDPAVDISTLSSPTFSFTASTSVQASNFASFGAPGPRRRLPTGSASPARATRRTCASTSRASSCSTSEWRP